MNDPVTADKVLLIGMMGAGKSTVGAALATRLGWPYLDNDLLLERTSGATAAEVLAAGGEQGLRAAEARVLTVMLALPGSVIGGLAAGVVLDASDRARIITSPSHVVWLRATPAVLGRRIGTGSSRPFLGADPLPVLRRMAAERQTLYAEVAHQIVDVDTLPASAVASLIVEALPVRV